MIERSKGKTFANWLRINFRKEETMRILFSDEKFFDIDGVDNSQNDRVWAVGCADADKKKVASSRDENLPHKVNGLIVCLFQGHNAFGNSWMKEQSIILSISKKYFPLH